MPYDKAGISRRNQKPIVHILTCLAISLAKIAPTTRPKPQLSQQARVEIKVTKIMDWNGVLESQQAFSKIFE